jgi:hypothetical protein
MPLVEILDGPPEWAGTQFEGPEEDMAEEIGLTHPRWRGTPVGIGWSALYAYRKVEVVGDRHRYRYQGPWGARRHRWHDGVEDLTGWDVLVVRRNWALLIGASCGAARSGCTRPRRASPARTRPGRLRSSAGRS